MFARKNFSRSGGLTITGIEQVIQSSTDFWTARIAFSIRRPEEVLLYRSLQAQNWGRSGEWIIPVCQTGIPADPPAYDVSWSDDWAEDFSIGPPPPIIPPGEGGLVTVAGLIGARSFTVGFEDPAFTPLPGMYFSIGNRLYLIGTVTPAGTRAFALTFAPGLRVAAPINTVVEFTSARCLMRLAEDDAGQMDLDMLRFADIQLNFVEIPA